MAQSHHHPSNASYKLETRPTFFIPGITGDPRWQEEEAQQQRQHQQQAPSASAAATQQQQQQRAQQQQRVQQQQAARAQVPQVPPIVHNRRSIRDLLLTPSNMRARQQAAQSQEAPTTPVRTPPQTVAQLTSPEHGVHSPWHFLPIQESPNMRRKRQMRRQQAKVQRVQRTIVGKESRRRERRKQERSSMLEKQPETIQEEREVSSNDGNDNDDVDDDDDEKQHHKHQSNDERFERSYLHQKKDLQPVVAATAVTTFTGTAPVSTSYYGDYKAAIVEEPDTPNTQTSWAQDIADTPGTDVAVTTRGAARLPTSRDFDRLAGMLNQISNKFTKENSVAHNSCSSRSSIDVDIEKSPQRPVISTHYQVPVSPLTEELSVPFTSVSSSEQEELESHTDYLVQEDLDGFDEDKFRQIEIRRAICFQIRRSLVRKDIWNHLQAFRLSKEERQIQIQTRLLRLKLDENKRKLQKLSSRRRKGGGDGWSTPEVDSGTGVCGSGAGAACSPVSTPKTASTTPEKQQPTPPSRESGDERLKPVPRNPLRPTLEQEATPPSRDLTTSSGYSQGVVSELSGSTHSSAFSPSELTSGSDSTYSSDDHDDEDDDGSVSASGSGSTYSSGSGLTPSQTTDHDDDDDDEDDYTSHADEYTTQSGSFCEDYDVTSQEDYASHAEYTTQTGDYTTQTGDDDDLISDYDDGVYSRGNASHENYATNSCLTSDPESYAATEEDPSTWSPSSLDESRRRQLIQRLRAERSGLSPIIMPSASKESRIEPPTTPHREHGNQRRVRAFRSSPEPSVESSPDSVDSHERNERKRQIALDLDAEEALIKMQEEAAVPEKAILISKSSSTFRPKVVPTTMTLKGRADMVTAISPQNESGIRMRQMEPMQKESPSTLFEKRLDRVIKRQEGVRKQNSSIGHKLQILGISPPNTPSLVSSIERDYSTNASKSDETDVSSIGSPLEPRQPYSVPIKTHERRPPKMLGEQSSVETMRAQNTTASWGSEGDDTWARSFSSGG